MATKPYLSSNSRKFEVGDEVIDEYSGRRAVIIDYAYMTATATIYVVYKYKDANGLFSLIMTEEAFNKTNFVKAAQYEF